jgi:hypothetical protein
MEKNEDINWFKIHVAPNLIEYEISYKYFENGDFGDLNQVEFNSQLFGGGIDFWGMGYIGIFIYDYTKELQVENKLYDPSEKQLAMDALIDMQSYLKSNV